MCIQCSPIEPARGEQSQGLQGFASAFKSQVTTDPISTVSTPAPATNGVSLSLRDIHRTFDNGVKAVDGITLSVGAGEFIAMLGPSGCGKSTLLRIIAELDSPSSGTIERSGTASTAYVFQDPNLLPWRTVLKNVALPLELRGTDTSARLKQAADALRQVGLEDAADRYPAQLSGGMRMRVSLARALVTNPSLLLLDEPFAALDEITRAHLDEQLRSLWIRRRMTIIFVTHSIIEAAFLADRAIVLSRRPAKTVVDMLINLPLERHNALRGQAAFAAHTHALLQALEKGGA